MYSLLTEELNNNNNNNNNNEIKLINKEFKNNSTKYMFNNKKEYNINVNNFNPRKNSPPNEWQSRLIKRINSYNLLQESNDLYD